MKPQMTGDEIVISGIAGKFPNCKNVKELQKCLLNKTDCITDSKVRWDYEHPHIPPRIGVMKNIDTFDRVFFGIQAKLADTMDPMMRMMIETSYEAITDAGINPRKLRGSKSAVFTGASYSESEKDLIYEKIGTNGLGIIGASRAMFSNRLSFFFGLQGPSFNIDSSCCGGANALQEGYRAIKEGRAENAIIGASNVVMQPNISLQLFLLGLLSPDGVTKSFDNDADGYTRSEGIVVFFLQKARDAKRIYAEVKNVCTIFGGVNNNVSLLYPTHEFQANVMKMTLKECGLSGKDIFFIEAEGTGIKDIDAEEVKAIDQVYNAERKSPLLIGSVKSNLGSSSAVNSLNGIIKIITAMETGYIPPNLNFKRSSDKIPALKEGRCKVVTELIPWTGDYAVVNSLALTGASANIILKAYKKEKKNAGRSEDNLPRLVICSGCTEEAIDVILDDMESRPVDVEMLQLMYDIFETEIPAHLYRGYTLLPPHGLLKTKTREVQFNSGRKKELWYMFSGMGSQWVGMGESLLQIPIFAEAINKCDKVLKPRGIDIMRIITEKDPKIFENIVNSFVGIAAIQIGLVDILNSIGLQPDFLIGHSVGELGCAYADGCFTAEQMILSALSRGLASVEVKMSKGSMAAVGLGYEEIKGLCPPDIDVACHNSASSSTISGPADSMKTFVAHLTAKKVFAKEVACSNLAFHSRYIAPAGEKLRKYLQEVIPCPKPRSNRWVSSSVPRDKWNSAKARLSSAEYHTNNLLNPVLFAETAKLIPLNAVVIEIAPHGLLQAIVKKSLPQTVINVPLTKRGHPDNVSFFFEALGKIYNAGCNINVSNLYPRITYPVSRGTPSISSLIRWDHSTNWFTSFFKQPKEVRQGSITFKINLKEKQWEFLKHVKINDKMVIPLSLYLILAWQVLKSFKDNSKTSVVYQQVQIHNRPLEISEDEKIELAVMVQKGTGFFEVTNNKNLLCSGILQATDTPDEQCCQVPNADRNYQDLSESDVYTELQMRGLQYSGPFKIIRKSSAKGNNGTLVWKKDWTTFLEGMIQIHTLGNDIRRAQVPIKIRKIVINLKLQNEIINQSSEIPATVYKNNETVRAGGIQMEGIVLKSIPHESSKSTVTEKLQIDPAKNESASNVYDHYPISSNIQQVSNWTARQLSASNLESICWVEEFSKISKNTIKVEYSAVNQSDILLATAQITLENTGRKRLAMESFGQEYSGLDLRGNRVMGISVSGALSDCTLADTEYIWTVPDNWSTVPLAHAIAYLALAIKGELQNKKSVFIYNGACSIGQAVINLALNIKSQVFVGHSNDSDENFLKINYPDIPEKQTISVTEVSDQILTQTEAKGVDLVIYNGDDLSNLETCLTCVKNGGRIIVIGNLQQSFSKSVGMQIFLKEIALFSIVPTQIMNLDLATKKKLSKMIESGIETGVLQTLPKRVYIRENLKNAFIDGALKNVTEKIIVKVQPENGSSKALAIARFLCKSEGSYLIIEGLSDFGLELVDYLVVRGARNIFIASESRSTRAYSNYRIHLWRRYGVSIVVREELDFSNQQKISALLKGVSKFGKVDAIFDLQRMDTSSRRSYDSKYQFTKHFFEESQKTCLALRQFGIFSTCKSTGENVKDILLRDINLTKICQEKSKNSSSGLLILLGPITGIATDCEKRIPMLSIPSIMEQLDNVIGLKASIISISHKSLEVNLEKIEEKVVPIEETAESKFQNYIDAVRPLKASSKFQV